MTNVSTRWMTLTAFFFISLMVAFLLLLHESSAGGEPPRVQYHVLESLSQDDAVKLEAELNAYGQAGWELVLVNSGNVTRPSPRFIFKQVELP
ncbi:MAG: hypothetical protein ABI988_17705 [Nitrospirota bacterium]